MNDIYGFFCSHLALCIPGVLICVLVLGYIGTPLWAWTIVVAIGLVGFGAPLWLIVAVAFVALIFNVAQVRQNIVSAPLMSLMNKLGLAPKISDTEKAALDAGSAWVEADFFSGHPDFKKLMQEAYPELTPEEKAYLDGPIEELCGMINDWQITQTREIPKSVWDCMKKIRIFGMIIPKEYGGLAFSALAHSEVIAKLSSRSLPVTITAMVPNSLGPAELLIHYGTDEQKKHYLPRLAAGDEIPCFALTEPRAGSDAGAIESEGILFKKGDKLFVRLNWNKRWITLAGVSTVLGLAFRLNDPEGHLGKGDDIGITCALIPCNTPGVLRGRRHDPLGIPFFNCPIQGKDVEIPVDYIIGGIANAGKGWTMLMESLGAGRGISLPAQATGTSKLAARIVSNHASIRKQFGVTLSKLEGVEEPMARIGAFTYLLEAMRRFTVGALDRGMRPSVITAIAKYNSTELGRKIGNDAMDILGGAGISKGPRNLVASLYIATPIGMTVEGANILTRTLIIFGQGLFRGHPWAYKEIAALSAGNLKAFDHALWSHIGHVFRNTFRSVLLSLTRGRLATSPVDDETKRYFQKLTWASASFALYADIAMGTLGGALKRKEKLSGRFADILSWMYMGTAVLRRYQAEGAKKEDLAFVHYALQHTLIQIQEAFDGIFANLRVPGLTWFFRRVIRSWARINPIEAALPDRIGRKASAALVNPGDARDRLTKGIYYPKSQKEALGRLEYAYKVIRESEPIEKKINQASRKRLIPKDRIYKLIQPALEKGVITAPEAKILYDAALARWDACQVDDFSEESYRGKSESQPSPVTAYHGPAGPPEPPSATL